MLVELGLVEQRYQAVLEVLNEITGGDAIVATGESRLYGNIILTKGIIRPD